MPLADLTKIFGITVLVMGVRFLPDQRLRMEDGTTLDGGPWLTMEQAGAAALTSRVLLHSYPEVRDVSDDPDLVHGLLGLVRTRPGATQYSAQLYSRGATSVLVLHDYC